MDYVWLAIYSEPTFKVAALAANECRSLTAEALPRWTDELPYATCDFTEAVADFYTQ
jgi:hypothetical protein